MIAEGDSGGLTPKEIACYAALVGFTSFLTTFITMYALQKLKT